MSHWLKLLIVLLVLGGLGYYFRVPLKQELAILEAYYAPCRWSITYSLGTFDTHFNLSKQNFLDTLAEAEAVWEKPINKNLFDYRIDGVLKINLIYDIRQQTTDELQVFDATLARDKASYDVLRAKYDILNAQFVKMKAIYDAHLATYRGHKSASEYAVIKKLEADLRPLANQINALVPELNALAKSLNINATTYNQISASLGEEFQEGVYNNNGLAQEINIFEFGTHDQLVRVLTHELGHALGLDHVDDPNAIMHKLNQSTNSIPTEDDIIVLRARCGIK